MPTPVPGWKPVNWEYTAQPAEQPGAIARPRIVDQLDALLSQARVVRVVAPGGSGKTTACAQWARIQQHPVIWLTASRFDTNPLDLVRLIATAYRAHELSGDDRSNRPPESIREVTALLNAYEDPATVVIDDLQRITSPDALAGLEELVNSTTKTRFILISRTASAMDLTTSTALIDRSTLDFDLDELEHAVSCAHSTISSAEIHAATGGWAAGSVLLLNQSAQNLGTPYQLASLFDRTLDQLPAELQDFVEATSITSTFDIELAAALTGRQDANESADACVRAGLLIDVLHDGLGTRYRWHDLFAEHCRERFRRLNPARYRALNAVAARHLAASRPHEAIDHASRAQDVDLALEVIRNQWLPLVLEGEAATLDAICQRLPAELAADPFVVTLRACCAAIIGDDLKAGILRDRAEHLEPSDHAGEVGLVTDVAALLTAHSAAVLVEACDSLQHRLRVEPIPPNTAAGLLFLLGWTEIRLRRESGGATRLLRSAFREATAQGLTRIARHAAANLSFALAYDGHFREAQRTLALLDAIASDEWDTYDGGLEDFCRGFIAYWQNDIETAHTGFHDAIAYGDGALPYSALASVFDAFVAAETGDVNHIADAAERFMQIDEKEAHGLPWPAYARLARALLAYAGGRQDIAEAVARTIPLDASTPTVLVKIANLYRQLGLKTESEHALMVLASRPDCPSYVSVCAALTRSLAALQNNRDRAAHVELEHAFDLAEPENISLPFSIRDPSVWSALELHAKWGSRHEAWIGRLLNGHDENTVTAANLTQKEREILNLLRTSMTAAEVADVLHLSLNTVKTHQRSIYRKLGVTNRRQAIQTRI